MSCEVFVNVAVVQFVIQILSLHRWTLYFFNCFHQLYVWYSFLCQWYELMKLISFWILYLYVR